MEKEIQTKKRLPIKSIGRRFLLSVLFKRLIGCLISKVINAHKACDGLRDLNVLYGFARKELGAVTVCKDGNVGACVIA